MSKGYAFTVGFAAAAIIVLAGISSTASTVAAERIGLTVAGGAAVLLISAAITPLLVRINRSIPLVDSSHPATAVTT